MSRAKEVGERVRELAAQEEQTTEQDEQEQAEQDEQQQPAPDEQEQPAPDEAEAVKRLDAEMTRHERALQRIFGTSEPLQPVELAGALGYMLPNAVSFRRDEHFQRCQVCNGMGQVLTDSFHPGDELADCRRCGNRGYLERLPDELQNGGAGTSSPPATLDVQAGFGVPAWQGDPSIRPGG